MARAKRVFASAGRPDEREQSHVRIDYGAAGRLELRLSADQRREWNGHVVSWAGLGLAGRLSPLPVKVMVLLAGARDQRRWVGPTL